jgi:hypothetical protein
LLGILLKRPHKTVFYAFGLAIDCDWDIPCPRAPRPFFHALRICEGNEAFFAQHVPAELRNVEPTRTHYHTLSDGSRYLSWRTSFEFHLSPDSKVITAFNLDGAPEAAFKTYMLGHVLSYALLGLGVETIHGASMLVDGGVVSFIGDSARGKSTLAASFMNAGYRLLSDDFLVLRRHGDADLAYPGFPRIKLYEQVSRHLIPQDKKGTPMTMHRRSKMIFSLEEDLVEPMPMRAFYALVSPKLLGGLKEVRIESLSEREAYLELTENSYNARVQTRERLTSQFQWATELVKRVPVKRLSYPRVLSILPDVIQAVKEDLGYAEPPPRKAFASTLPTRTP